MNFTNTSFSGWPGYYSAIELINHITGDPTEDILLLIYGEPDTNYAADIAANPDGFAVASVHKPGYLSSPYDASIEENLAGQYRHFETAPTQVPEPASVALLGFALAGFGAIRLRRRKRVM